MAKMKVVSFELFSVDLLFRTVFKTAAAERTHSESIFVRCTTESGVAGWGECLPRVYVTGEIRDQSFTLLRDFILPRLIGMKFATLEEVVAFLTQCDGRAPVGWLEPGTPQTASWSAVDLSLLDAFGRAFGDSVRMPRSTPLKRELRYSAVVSAGQGYDYVKTLAKVRLFDFRQVKLKVGKHDSLKAAHLARRILGTSCDIRVDANMAWSEDEALNIISGLAECGIHTVEQPLDFSNVAGLSRLVRGMDVKVIADEGMHDRDSLAALITHRACTGVNIRISKCGGLVAALARCNQAFEAGLSVQVGCQVGESSLLSAAQLILISSFPNVEYLEGCFGTYLLQEDPLQPRLQFGYGGRPPRFPNGKGLAVTMNPATLARYVLKRAFVIE